MKNITRYSRQKEQQDAKRRLVLEMLKAGIPSEDIMSGMRLAPLNILWMLLESVRQGEVSLRSPQQVKDAEHMPACPDRVIPSRRGVIDPLSAQLIEELQNPACSILRLATDGKRLVLLAPQRLFPTQKQDQCDETEHDNGGHDTAETSLPYAHLYRPLQ